MSKILDAFLMPHPAIMLEEVGGRETEKVKASVRAAEKVGEKISRIKPDTIVIISPHGPVFQDALCLYDYELKGSFASFGTPEVQRHFIRDSELAEEIIKKASENAIPVVRTSSINLALYGIKRELDHGVMVPMYFVTKYTTDFKLLPIAFGMLSYEDLYAFGTLITKAAEDLNRKIVLIASGDLSHRLTPDAPAGFNPKGREFDEKLVGILRVFDPEALQSLDRGLIEAAGECGLRSIWTMAGSLDGYRVKPDVLSYEGPFGVGYCIAEFTPMEKRESLLEKLYSNKRAKIQERRKKEDEYVKLARRALENYVTKHIKLSVPKDLPEEMLAKRAGVFVSIKKDGELRGCIGTFLPTKANIAEEIIQNAISAGTQDPRFEKVSPEELEELTYSVDVLTKPEPIDSAEQLDPKKYGVIVRKGYRSGLLLPDLEGVDTVEEQVNIALRKAGINPWEDYKLERFKVVRHY